MMSNTDALNSGDVFTAATSDDGFTVKRNRTRKNPGKKDSTPLIGVHIFSSLPEVIKKVNFCLYPYHNLVLM
jgi:hypothetical protein